MPAARVRRSQPGVFNSDTTSAGSMSLKDLEDGSVLVGLVLLERVIPRGVVLSQTDIAFVCGCSSNNINAIEQRALGKLRAAFIAYFRREGILMETDNESELAQKIWAVVGATRICATDVTYDAAVKFVEENTDDDSLTITTAAAAARVPDDGR